MVNCRICLKSDSELSSLFKLAGNKYLPAVVYNISGVKILRKLEPKAKICSKCKRAVVLSEKIILRCQESEQYIQNERLKKPETHTQTPQSIDSSNAIETEDSPTTLTNDTANETNRESKDNCSKKSRTYDLYCDHCSFGCNTARALVKHRKETHDIDDDNIFPCHMCKERFPWKSTLNRHIQNYHQSLPDDKKFLCTECGSIYTSRKHLIEHQNQRHGPRRFRCVEPNCKQTFTRAFTLRRHFLTAHHCVSSYYCDDCNESFKVYDHWKYHNKIVHNNQKRDFQTYKKND